MPVLRVLGKGTDREREGRMGSQEQAPPPGTAGRLGRWYEQVREEVDGGQGQAEASAWTSCSREGPESRCFGDMLDGGRERCAGRGHGVLLPPLEIR